MSTRKCGCVYSDARNNSAVRARMEMPGSLMKRCAKHQAEWDAAIASEPIELTAEQKLARADTRIAELEKSVTIRDTEIARLETDLELERAKVAELTADNGSMLRLLTDIRFALGDDGKRMQAELVEYCKELRAAVVALRDFAQCVTDSWPHGDVDGYELERMAVAHGLLALKYPKPTEPCGENCACAGYPTPEEWTEGIDCYVRTPLLKGEIDEARAGNGGES